MIKLREDFSMQENIVYGGDKFNRTEIYEYGDLLDLLDTTKKQIDYNKNIYTSEIEGIEKRRKSLKTTFTYNLFFLILLFLFDLFFSKVMMSSGGIVMQAGETWIGIGGLFVANIYMIIRVIKALIIYGINISPEFMIQYVVKHDIHTMVEEKLYCEQVLRQMLEYEAIVSKIEKGIKAETIDPETAKDEISKMNFDIKEFRYTGGRSVR